MSAITDRLAAALGRSYTVMREPGQGGWARCISRCWPTSGSRWQYSRPAARA